MSQPLPAPFAPRCQACGATVPGNTKACWLCHEPLVVTAEAIDAPPNALARSQEAWSLHAAIWAAVVVCAVLLFALTMGQNKYYAIGFAIIVAPALAIVLGGATLGRLLGKPWHPVVKIAMGSMIALVLLPVAVVVSLFILCTDLCSGKL